MRVALGLAKSHWPHTYNCRPRKYPTYSSPKHERGEVTQTSAIRNQEADNSTDPAHDCSDESRNTKPKVQLHLPWKLEGTTRRLRKLRIIRFDSLCCIEPSGCNVVVVHATDPYQDDTRVAIP